MHSKWSVLWGLVLFPLLTSCGGDEPEDSEPVASKEKINVSNSSVSILAEGESKTIEVKANCSWTVSIEGDDANWITVNPNSGHNDGSFTINATENTTEAQRQAILIIAGKTLTRTVNVTQKSKEISLSVDVSSLSFSVNGENKTFNISSNCSWSIEGPEWCKLSQTSGSNDQGISVTVEENTTGGDRTGEIVVSSQSGRSRRISVKQDGGNAPEITDLQLGTPSSSSISFSFNLSATPAATEFGVYYSDSKKEPTDSDAKASGTLTDGTVQGKITNLEQNKTYYVRAYAKNALGTTYSETKTFTTTQNVPGNDDNIPPTP